MTTHIVCVIQPRGAIEILGSYGDAGEAARACNTSGPGAHVVCDGAVLRFHGRTDKRMQSLVEKALRERKHPALARVASGTIAAPEEPADDDETDELEPAESEREIEPASSAAPVADEQPDRTHTEVQRGRGGPPKPVTVRGRTLTRAQWAAELGVSETAIYLSVKSRGGTWEDEIERRLALREATGSAKSPGPSRGARRPPTPREQTSPVADACGDSTDGTLDDLREILRVAAEHGGLRRMVANAELGRRVRSLTEEARG